MPQPNCSAPSAKAFKYRDEDSCFSAYDRKGQGRIDEDNFKVLCCDLFVDGNGIPYDICDSTMSYFFETFDDEKNGFLDKPKFHKCWEKWIKIIIEPTSVLIIVDMQNDFIKGSLKIPHNGTIGPEDLINSINELMQDINFKKVIYTMDWHPHDHISFVDNTHLRKIDPSSPVQVEDAGLHKTVIFAGNPPREQTLWPKHCVQNTWGAKIHQNLKLPCDAMPIHKGTDSEVDSYSAFWDNLKLSQTNLNEVLQSANATDIYICGLAIDFCVGGTAIDGIGEGYRTILVDDCTMGIQPDRAKNKIEEIKKKGGVVVKSEDVKAMVNGFDRKLELGRKLASNLRKSVCH